MHLWQVKLNKTKKSIVKKYKAVKLVILVQLNYDNFDTSNDTLSDVSNRIIKHLLSSNLLVICFIGNSFRMTLNPVHEEVSWSLLSWSKHHQAFVQKMWFNIDIGFWTKQSDYSLLLFAVDKLFANHFSNSFIKNIVNNVSCDQTMELKPLYTNNVNVTSTQKMVVFVKKNKILNGLYIIFVTYAWD